MSYINHAAFLLHLFVSALHGAAAPQVDLPQHTATVKSGDWRDTITALPESEREKWQRYLEKSAAAQQHQRAALAAELPTGQTPVAAPSGGTFKWDPKKTPAGSPEAATLAASLLTWQIPCGGWSKAIDYLKGPRLPGMAWTSQKDPWHYAATLDNRATTGQLEFLAAHHQAAPSDKMADAIRRGVQWLLDAQFPSGGWPQVYPLEGGYHDSITLNDGAMQHALEVLTVVRDGSGGFGFLPPDLRAAAGGAVSRGIQCLLRSQLTREGKPTAWCAQHHPVTLAPLGARAYEPPSLSGSESCDLVRWLMTLPQPDKAVTASIDGAIAWFESVRLPGEKHGDAPRWARFYDLQSHTPIFQGKKDHIIYKDFAEMARHNPLGYDYFTTRPNDLAGKWAARWRAGKPLR